MIKKYSILSVISLFLFCLTTISLQAQNADTAMFRKLQIKEINSWVKLPMMLRQKDSCLSETRKLNEKGMVTYIRTNYGCMGWNRVDETFFKYNDKLNLIELKNLSNDVLVSHTFYKYDNKGTSVYEKRIFFDPFDSIEVYYTPTYDKKGNVIQERVVYPGKQQEPYTRLSTYKNNLLSVVEVRNDTGETVAKYSYFYNDDNKIEDETSENLKPNYTYSKELYDYEDGQLIRKTNTLDNTATEFIYHPNGLIYKTLWYNRFGQLERIYYNFYESKAK